MIREGKGSAATATANLPHCEHIGQNDTDGLQAAAGFQRNLSGFVHFRINGVQQ